MRHESCPTIAAASIQYIRTLADRETSGRKGERKGEKKERKKRKGKQFLALMSVNEGSKVPLDAFPVDERPSTGSVYIDIYIYICIYLI